MLWPITDTHLTLFEATRAGCRKLWQSPDLCVWRSEQQHWDEVALKVADLTGGGVPEVAVWEMAGGAGWAPCHLDLFTLRGNRLVKITGLSSNDLIWIDDLDHDGRYEIGTWHEIGDDMCHAAQPRWGDIYAWKNGRYVLANEDFPRQFHGWEKDLRETAKCFPLDPEIREYLGIVREIERRPRAALAAYRSALFLYRSRFDWNDAPRSRSKLRTVGARMATVRSLIRKRGRGRA